MFVLVQRRGRVSRDRVCVCSSDYAAAALPMGAAILEPFLSTNKFDVAGLDAVGDNLWLLGTRPCPKRLVYHSTKDRGLKVRNSLKNTIIIIEGENKVELRNIFLIHLLYR